MSASEVNVHRLRRPDKSVLDVSWSPGRYQRAIAWQLRISTPRANGQGTAEGQLRYY